MRIRSPPPTLPLGLHGRIPSTHLATTGVTQEGRDVLLCAVFSLFGFDVYVDASWLLLAVLITWSLAVGVFPSIDPGLTSAAYWSMAVVATVGLLFSIVFHEMSHAAVAQGFGMPIRGITLFIFGGVAEMHSEPTSALSEFLMALAGPIASAVLGLLFFLLVGFVVSLQGPTAIAGVLRYLSYLNWTLAVFNLVPAFPLDGGRMLRAALWGWRKDLIWATSIAAVAGNIFGILLIVLGLIEVLRGDFVGGIWLSLMGLFLRGAASATYEQTLARQILGWPPGVSFYEPAANYRVARAVGPGARPGLRLSPPPQDFPVVRDGRLLGCVTTAQVSEVDEDNGVGAR